MQNKGLLVLKSVTACNSGSWTLITWPQSRPSRKKARPFECKSWRHPGACRWWKGAQDFVRVRDAVRKRKDWVYIVLTFDPKQWRNDWAAYRGGYYCWNRLRRALCKLYGRIEYIQTWERHQSGFPHLNVIVHSSEISARCADDGWKEWRQFLKREAVEAGFGEVLWVEPIRGRDAISGYLTKVSRELVGATTKNQVPVNAPHHFRRIRASRGTLPKVLKREGVTGKLVSLPCDVPGPVKRPGKFQRLYAARTGPREFTKERLRRLRSGSKALPFPGRVHLGA
jgi:hypothetical protein